MLHSCVRRRSYFSKRIFFVLAPANRNQLLLSEPSTLGRTLARTFVWGYSICITFVFFQKMELCFFTFYHYTARLGFCPWNWRGHRKCSPMDLRWIVFFPTFRTLETHLYFVYGLLARYSCLFPKNVVVQTNTRSFCSHYDHRERIFNPSA